MAKCPSCGGKLAKTQLSGGGAAGGGRNRAAPGGEKPLAAPDMGMYLVCMNEECGNYLVMDGKNLPTSEKCPECGKAMQQAQVAPQTSHRLGEDGEAQARGKKEVYQCQKCKSIFPPKAIEG